jgi:hypothetical protein
VIRRPAVAALLLLAGCAQMQAPPGGPEDRQGPRLVTTRPDTMARMSSFPGPVVILFDEGLSEEGVEDAVEVSPRTSSMVVEKRGEEIRVDLRRGWERNRVYQVTVEPLIQDRFNNKIEGPVRVVFSTGPEIPNTRLTGSVVERTTGNAAQRIRVEAELAADSLVYTARTDSVGTFVFERIPVGRYRIRAYNDPNKNREMEPYEARDTAVATVGGGPSPELSLSIITPDSTAPRLAGATFENGVVTLRFDDFLDPSQPLEGIAVRLQGADSAAVAIAEVQVGALQVTGDSTGQDSAAADSARRPSRTARADSARADSTRRRGPAPAQTLAVRTAAALAPDASYRITVSGVRNLLGLAGGGSVQFRTPRAAPTPAAQPPATAAQTPPVASPPAPPSAPPPPAVPPR